MSKFIILVLVLVAFYVLLRAKSRRRSPPPRRPARSAEPESFVVCAHCGVNVPSSEAVSFDGRSYCCEEHRQLG
jgi:uncharacterized protein